MFREVLVKTKIKPRYKLDITTGQGINKFMAYPFNKEVFGTKKRDQPLTNICNCVSEFQQHYGEQMKPD